MEERGALARRRLAPFVASRAPSRSCSVRSRGRDTRRAGRGGRLRGHARSHRGVRHGRRRGHRLEDPPCPQPLRSGRGRHQRGSRQRVGRRPGEARVRHGQGRRLPRRPGRDRDPLRRGAGRRVPARAVGRRLLAYPGRQDRAAALRRGGRATHRVRGRHHGPRPAPGALRADHEARPARVRRVVRVEARRRRRALPGRHLLGPRERRPRHAEGEDRDPLHGRRGPAVRRHDERVRVHGRRDGAGAARRRAAEGHGDDAVPPDDARADGRAHHRGLPRRGRLPPQLRERALPQGLCAERDGAGVAGRHLARRADRDRRRARHRRQRPARPAPPRRGEDPRARCTGRASCR